MIDEGNVIPVFSQTGCLVVGFEGYQSRDGRGVKHPRFTTVAQSKKEKHGEKARRNGQREADDLPVVIALDRRL